MRILSIILSFMIITHSHAAFDYPAISAHNAGLANSALASTVSTDGFLLNPALSVNNDSFSAGLNYFQLFNLKELTYSSGQTSFSFKGMYFGVGIQTFGETLYRENKMTLNSAKKFISGKMAVGLSLNIYNIDIENYDNINAWGLDVGFCLSLSESWHVAGVIESINQPKLNGHSEELPNRVQLGFEYRVADPLYANLSIQKDAWFSPMVLIGIEYRLSMHLRLNSGFASEANLPAAGVGLNVSNIAVNYAVQHHFVLGPTHFVGITYAPQTN